MQPFTPEERKAWLEGLHKVPAGAAMLLEDSTGKLLVVKAHYKTYWTMPGGVIDEGESPIQAAIRETMEEVGIALSRSTVEFVAVVYRKSDMMDTYQFIFTAPISTTDLDSITLQASEIDSFAFVTKDQVLSSDRQYAHSVADWANGIDGYTEHTIVTE
jgi:8-oxo-dGTP diphosphatase